MIRTTDIFKSFSLKEHTLMLIILIVSLRVYSIAHTTAVQLITTTVFFSALILISFCDYRQQIIPDILLIPILFSGIIGANLFSIIGFFLPSTIFLIIAYTKEGVGGGDIKLMAATGFVLGVHGALIAALLGLLLFLLTHISASKNKAYALAPSLSIGCFFAYVFF